jgi:hypothetical protein
MLFGVQKKAEMETITVADYKIPRGLFIGGKWVKGKRSPHRTHFNSYRWDRPR